MKTKLTIFFAALIFGLGYGQQNQSNLAILPSITPAAVLPPGNVEAFRFRSGLVTQLDSGLGFGFDATNQWNSFGRLTTSGQTLFGYRTQRAGRGLIFGFTGPAQSTTPTTGQPVIEWVGSIVPSIDPGNVPETGETAGDLLFRTSSSSTSATSTQVMRMTSDGNSVFSTGPTFYSPSGLFTGTVAPNTFLGSGSTPKVEIQSTSAGLVVASEGGNFGTEAGVFYSNSSGGTSTGGAFGASGINSFGIKSIANTLSGAGQATGAQISARTGTTAAGTTVNGVVIDARFATNNNGIIVNTAPRIVSSTGVNFGINVNVIGNTGTGSTNYGLYATASGLNSYAGYFNGRIFATSALIVSDKSLKKDILVEKSTIANINKLKPVTYNMIQDNAALKMNLPRKLQHGFVAQELELVYPELVEDVMQPIFDENSKQTGTKALKSVNYIGLISVLTQALQEVSSELTVLKEKIKTLEGKKEILNAKTSSNTAVENGYLLSQNAPNPFNSSTIIQYSLPANTTNANILVFNFSGETIKEYKLSAANGTVILEAAGLLKGIYFYALVVNDQEIITKKMILN